MRDTMRDLLSKLDQLVSETALNPKDPKGDYEAKSKALQDLQMDPVAAKDPEISKTIMQRKADLEREAKSLKIKTETFEVGDAFGISFSEDYEIGAEIVGFVADGIVIELDDAALTMLESQGLKFIEGELQEGKQKGVDGKACWKGYKRMGTKQKGGRTVDNCVKMEGSDDIADKGEYDREGEMAQQDLTTASDAADELRSILDADDNLPEWVQAKITKAVDYLDTTRDYMKSKDVEEASKIPFAGKKAGHKEGPAGQWRNDGPSKDRPARKGDLVGGESISNEAEYQGKEVPLGKKLPGDVKKSKVYVRKPNGKVVKVNFGDKKMRIKKSNPARRKSFRARHNCANPGPRHKARYWSCRSW